MLFAKVNVLVLDGIIPESEVAGIRKGRGSIDTAGDCIALREVDEHVPPLGSHRVSRSAPASPEPTPTPIPAPAPATVATANGRPTTA